MKRTPLKLSGQDDNDAYVRARARARARRRVPRDMVVSQVIGPREITGKLSTISANNYTRRGRTHGETGVCRTAAGEVTIRAIRRNALR